MSEQRIEVDLSDGWEQRLEELPDWARWLVSREVDGMVVRAVAGATKADIDWDERIMALQGGRITVWQLERHEA